MGGITKPLAEGGHWVKTGGSGLAVIRLLRPWGGGWSEREGRTKGPRQDNAVNKSKHRRAGSELLKRDCLDEWDLLTSGSSPGDEPYVECAMKPSVARWNRFRTSITDVRPLSGNPLAGVMRRIEALCRGGM